MSLKNQLINRPGVYLSIFAMIYTLSFCAALPYYIDESYTFNLATDPSLSHMLLALRNGADGSFPLFAIFVFTWEKIFGSSEMSLRISGAMFVIFLANHAGKRLTQ